MGEKKQWLSRAMKLEDRIAPAVLISDAAELANTDVGENASLEAEEVSEAEVSEAEVSVDVSEELSTEISMDTSSVDSSESDSISETSEVSEGSGEYLVMEIFSEALDQTIAMGVDPEQAVSMASISTFGQAIDAGLSPSEARSFIQSVQNQYLSSL